MRKTVITLLLGLFLFVASMPILASNNFTVEIETYLDNTQKGNPSPGIPNKRRGEKITFSKSGPSDYDFAFYAVNGVIRDDLPEDYQFTVRSNLKITAIFHKANRGGSSLEHVVVFADSNGHILDVTYVIPGASVTEPANLPSKPNMVHSNPKWKTTSGITSLDDISSSRVYFLQYSVSEVSTFTVTTNAETNKTNYEYNEVATLTANLENEGVPFSHYEDAKGHVLSTNRIYKFTVFKDITVNAVYGNEKPSTPLVNMSDTLSLRGDNTTSYVGQFELSSGYELIEYGFVISRSSDVLTLESLGAKVIASNVHNGETREFLRTFENDAYNSIRAYLIVLNTNGEEAVEEVIYSENYKRTPESIGEAGTYSAGFDGISKASYAKADVIVNDISWTLDEALVAADDPLKIGTHSVRSKGQIYTNSGFSGITNITFKAAIYGSDDPNSVLVSVSNDGINWVDVTDALVGNTLSSELQDYSLNLTNSSLFNESTLSTSELLRVKLEVAVLGERINIDEINIMFDAFNGPIHEIKYNVDGVVTEEMIANNGSITYEPTKEDHDFVGWYYLDAENNQVDFSGPIIQSRTLYAKFEIQSRTITFHYNGADGGQMPATQVVQIGSQAVLPIPTRTGYVFLGWFNESLTTEYDDPYKMPTINRNMYAKWEQTDEGKVLDDLNSISLPSVITEATTLDLIDIGTNGSTITWSSSNETLINPISGVVTLPTDENTEVILTATGVFNGVERSKTFVITVNKQGSSAVQKEITYKFKSKSWEATSSIDGGDETAENWTLVKAGNGFATQGIQVSTGASGAKGTSKSIDNIVAIEVIYATNASKGKGTIEVSIGSSIVQTYMVTTVGGVTPRSAGIVSIDNLSGAVSIEVTTTTNSIYINSIIITYLD
ncbi:putative extracellular nuclease, surface-anchored [Paracholeplasma brassicae]|uniref:Putative extracellular nuclease, surface-anchored n=1 Tax=Acholeplasma brassicae TaxID=61635 RepID=U4KPV0_9MOLU|nr:InlB B-repeat-containing protein [Paracholeplasma brassicae]CCV66512.1 putative extracellular nuclease, surface-anchored [Paracholeplasma brassicae]